jgi:hypothetical protein
MHMNLLALPVSDWQNYQTHLVMPESDIESTHTIDLKQRFSSILASHGHSTIMRLRSSVKQSNSSATESRSDRCDYALNSIGRASTCSGPGIYLCSKYDQQLASLRACTWNVEHGVDPEAWVERGKKAAQQALSINKNYSFAYGNLGTIYHEQISI